MSTLSTLAAHTPFQAFDPSLASGNSNSKSMFSSFLPNLQGQGPIGSFLRIIQKLHHYSLRHFTIGLGKEKLGLRSQKKEEEMRVKAVKVLDLLQHSTELGNSEALYTLARLSLVSLLCVNCIRLLTFRHLVPPNPSLRVGSRLGIQLLFHTCGTYRKRVFSCISCIFL